MFVSSDMYIMLHSWASYLCVPYSGVSGIKMTHLTNQAHCRNLMALKQRISERKVRALGGLAVYLARV